MEEETLGMISYTRQTPNRESSDSNTYTLFIPQPHKQSRIMERYKGVVPQQNGHWGAQIYSNHQRIWLGTFKSEADAAIAYDSAAIKLRNGDSHRNFPLTNATLLEPKFQSHFSTDAVLNMIRDGSYPNKLAEFLRRQQGEIPLIGLNEYSCTLLFQKELTPSDVGKLNRLVVPKRHAVKHFPSVPDGERVDEVQLEFYDREMNLWKFRYCYWKSSQSFVFTRGWNRFVKEKGLRANDTIYFYSYETSRGGHYGQSFLVIDVTSQDGDGDTKKMGLGDFEEGGEELLGLGHGNDAKGFKLFGVQID